MLPSYHEMVQQSDRRREELLHAAVQHRQAQQSPARQTGPGPLDTALGKLGSVMVNVGEGLQARGASHSIATDRQNLEQCC